jgi:O-methyltransferase
LYPHDTGFTLHLDRTLAVSVEEVRKNFSRFALLDDQISFTRGLFRDTLPSLSSRRWAVVRLDGDLYESTMDGLTNLYPALSPGGFIIVDDYGAYPPCAAAVDEYRAKYSISEPIVHVDWTGVYWRKTGP